MMTISEDFLFRLEKFGGILINKVTFDRIELDESEAYFLYLVQNHGFEIATSFFKKEIKAGKLERVLLLNIYSDNNIEGSSKNPDETLQNARKHVAKLKKHNILSFPLELVIYPSKAYSNRQTNRFDDLLKSNLTLDLIIGVAFAVFVIIFGNVILKQLYGFKGHLLSLSTIYLVFMSPYIGLTLLNFSLTNLLRVQKKTKPIMWVGLISSLIDVVLNYVLVPQIGIKGAAISTIVSLAFISLSYLFMVYPMILKALSITSTTKFELITFGIPLVGQEILESVLFIMVFDALMSRLGVELLAIYAVISQLLSIVSVPSFVYSTTVSIYLPEAEKIGEVNVFLKNIFKNSYGVSLLLACPIVLSSNVLAHFLSDEITSNIIPLTLYTFIIMGISPIYESSKMLLQVTENEKFVLQVSIWINLICVAIMILFQFLRVQTYFSLYFIYGLSLTVLSIIFLQHASSEKII